MTALSNNYSTVLKKNKVAYMPSCLIVEMMTGLYRQVARINVARNLRAAIPDILTLLQRLTANISATTWAHQEARIRYFVGDWQEDKVRARKLFFNLMSRFGYLLEQVDAAGKEMLTEALDDMSREWTLLDSRLSVQSKERHNIGWRDRDSQARGVNSGNWQKILARILFDYEAQAAARPPDAYLMVLCYSKIRDRLMQEIKILKEKTGSSQELPIDRIVCISDRNIPITCQKCDLITDNITENEPIPEKPCKESASRRISLAKETGGKPGGLRRLLMPGTLADIIRRR